MNQVQAFLDDIRDDPGDDAVRLIFADWLEENDEADRAEFIRLQIESDRTDIYDARYPAQIDRENELLGKHQKAWLGKLAAHLKAHAFRRGLLDEVSVRVEMLLKHAKLFRDHPVRVLKLHFEPDDTDRAAEVARCPALTTVETLDLSGNHLTADAMRALAGSRRLGRLRHLNLSTTRASDGVVEAAVTGAIASRLESLDLSGNHLGVNAVETLARSGKLDNLQALRVGSCKLGTARVEMLTASRRLPLLRALDLRDNILNAAAARALADCPRLAQLRWLNLASNSIGPAGAAALAGSPHLRQLERLQLLSNNIGHDGMAELAKGGFLDHMVYLELSGNLVGEAGVRALVGSRPGQLTYLHFGTDDINDKSLKLLAGWPALASVRELNLYNNRVTAFGMRALIDSPYSRGLVRMNLERNHLGDLGAQVLAVWPGLARMRWLKLRDNHIGDEGAVALARSPHLELLTDLDLSSNPCDNAKVREVFSEVRPRVRRLAPWDHRASTIDFYPPFTPQRPRG